MPPVKTMKNRSLVRVLLASLTARQTRNDLVEYVLNWSMSVVKTDTLARRMLSAVILRKGKLESLNIRIIVCCSYSCECKDGFLGRSISQKNCIQKLLRLFPNVLQSHFSDKSPNQRGRVCVTPQICPPNHECSRCVKIEYSTITTFFAILILCNF